jgi:hypothetical protein
MVSLLSAPPEHDGMRRSCGAPGLAVDEIIMIAAFRRDGDGSGMLDDQRMRHTRIGMGGGGSSGRGEGRVDSAGPWIRSAGTENAPSKSALTRALVDIAWIPFQPGVVRAEYRRRAYAHCVMLGFDSTGILTSAVSFCRRLATMLVSPPWLAVPRARPA